MLADKPWEPEAVLMLIVGGVVCVGAGSLCTTALELVAPSSSESVRALYRLLPSTICVQGGMLLFLTQFLRQHGLTWARWLGLDRPGAGRAVALAVGTAALTLPVIWGLNWFSAWLIERLVMPPEPQQLIQMFNRQGPAVRVFMGAVAIGVAPVVEEAIFRGVLYGYLKERGYSLAAVMVSSLLFAAVHFNLMTFLPLTALAIVLAWLYETTGRLLAPILTHALFNAANVVMLAVQVSGQGAP